MLEAFCIFVYRVFYKNLLCILVFTHQRVYGKESLVPTQTLKMFKGLDNKVAIEHLQWHFKQTSSLSFDHLFSINDDLTVYCTKTHPIQFKFGKVNDMLTFYNKQGEGWTNVCINKYFKQKKSDDASGGVQRMTISQQFEEVCNQFETMHQIKVKKISNEYKFSIKYLLENYQANNSTLRARHHKMFKEDTYEFEPIKELVLTMSLGFIVKLKKRLESYVQEMARQIEAAFKECREQINQADLLKTTDWYIEFG